MKFSVGDPVYIKSSNEEGVILEFISKDIASVKVDKSIFHAYLDDLEHPYLRWFLNKEKKPVQKAYIDNVRKDAKYQRVQQLADGVYLVFFPQYKVDEFDEVVTKLKVFCYNETQVDLSFEYSCRNKESLLFELRTEVRARHEFYIHDISFEEAASNPQFTYRFVNKIDSKLEIEDFYSLKSKKLHEFLHEIRHENKPFFSIQLFEEILPKEKKEIIVNPNLFKAQKEVPKNDSHFNFEHALKKTKYEVDLHIEKLVSNNKQLSPSEMIQIQLKECQNALDLAIATHQRSLVLIHGVGNGKLKSEIHLLLNQTKGIQRYVYDYDSRYGYGATEVFF